MVPNTNTRPSAHANLRTPWGVLLVTMGVTVLVTWMVASYSRAHQRALFERNAELVRMQIASRVDTYIALLRSGAAYFHASENVSKNEFRQFVRGLEIGEAYPGIQGLGYTVRISPAERDAALQEFTKTVAPDFRFWPDADPNSDFFAIIFLEPQDARNRAASGYDMRSEPIRREAMDKARDTGLPQATERVTLVQEIEKHKQPGFLIYVPVYRYETSEPASVAGRREQLQGFVYGAFRAHDFLNAALSTMNFRNLGVQVFDGTTADPEELLFRLPSASGDPARLDKVAHLDVAGTPWTIYFSGDAELGLAAPHIIVPMTLGSGTILSFLLFAVTMKLAAANAEAARSRQLFERIADATPDVLYVHNIETQQNLFINQEVKNVLGYSREQIRALGPNWLAKLVHPDDLPAMHEYMRRLAKLPDGAVLQNEARVLHSDGGYRWLFSRDLAFSRGSDGKVLEILGLATDITERRATEEALRAASQAKDEFLAALSHELRTPLTPVLAIISTLEQDCRIAPELREELGIARRNVELEARLIDDLLDLTRIVRGKLALHVEPVDLRDLAEHTAASVMELREKNIDFAIEWRADESFVNGDRSRLTQLLWNLLKNAAKFTVGSTPVRLRATNQEGGPGDRPWLVIEVEDKGVGIEPDVLPRVFRAFEQGDIRITRRFGGLGLGLTISKAIVEMHGGEIAAASEGRGQGARFIVRLPTIPKPLTAKKPVESGGSQTSTPALAGLRLLLVEDHIDTAVILSKRLRRAGIHVVHADSVEAGLSAAEQAANAGEPFELVLSDLGLPDGTGFELMKMLSQRHGLRGVALSGFGMESDIRKSEEAGFLRHLTKPVDFELLKRVLTESMSCVEQQGDHVSRF